MTKTRWSEPLSLIKQLSLAALIGLPVALMPAMANADAEGFFLEGGAYYTQFDDDIDRDDIDWDEDDLRAFFDDSSAGFNLGAGYRFNKWLSVDAGYWDLGDFKSDRTESGNKIDFETTAWTVGGMVSVPLWILDVYVRAGAAMWDVDTDELSEDGTDPYYGVGAALNIFGSLDLYAEVIRFDTDRALDTAGLGVRFTF